ncbi:MAG: 50S ribosomal protein L15 [Anaerohalosphaeraceae bacterium]|nr:50S ribosomal protein L15 [Anaerohalosphaeraceae bacterium]
MLSHEITSVVGKSKSRKRIGRGTGSGVGKTCGRGHKGCGSRAGSGGMLAYEGGQMPLFRRIPKRGFSNYDFADRYEIVNVSQLDRFDDGFVVDSKSLYAAGLVDRASSRVKLLGDGQLTKKLQVNVQKFSKSAQEKILSCGGTAKVVA